MPRRVRCASCFAKHGGGSAAAATVTAQECAGCIGTYYCSERCQREHWPVHVAVCMAFAPLRPMLAAGTNFDDLPDELIEAVFRQFVKDDDVHYRAATRLALRSVRFSRACARVFRERYWFDIGRRDMAPFDPENDANLENSADPKKQILVGPLWVRRYRAVMREFRDAIQGAENRDESLSRFWAFMCRRHASALFANTLTPNQRADVCSVGVLALADMQIRELPREIGELAELRWLFLHKNQLSELLPEIGRLKSLERLFLADNQLGELPPEIGQLTALERLDLNDNRLPELPPEIGQLTALERLDLAGNDISELPPQIGQLAALRQLDLAGNDISELPPQIGQLAALKYLDLADNELSTLPPQIGQLAALGHLNLRDNQLQELPREIAQLAALQALSLYNNPDLGDVSWLSRPGLMILGAQRPL